MDLQIKGKKAIMAGGSAGMGRATAERLAEGGVDLVITARREEHLRNAAKEIADHAVLLPDGIRFSPSTTRRDWTNEWLARIQAFYARYTDEGGGSAVDLQGIRFDTNRGGRLPLQRYLAATLEETRNYRRLEEVYRKILETDPGVKLENFASFLAHSPPQEDVTLVEPSSWSCAHGVDRWRRDCGCKMDPSRPSQQPRTRQRPALPGRALP